MYYTTEGYLRNAFDNAYRPYAFRAASQEDYFRWKREFAAHLARLLGMGKMTLCTPEPQHKGTETLDGYTREKVILYTEPGIQMPLYVLKPANASGRMPVVIAPHGHVSNGKSAVCGIDKGDGRLRAAIDSHNYDYGVQLVKQGFLVFCPDARGFGERAEKFVQSEQNPLNGSCFHLNAMAVPLGMNVTGMWVWDLVRLLDWALTRDDADADRVSCAGLSGGGLQTLWFTALDDRVRSAVVSGYFYGYKQALLEQHNHCSCNYVPGLWECADMGDIGALIADRHVFIETGDADPLNGADGVGNVFPQVDTVRRAAKLLGNDGGVRHHVFNGPHKWCGEESIPWLKGRNGL